MTDPRSRTIGRYEVRREIGRGTMGVVYEGYDPDLDRTVALKTISLAFAVSPKDRESFERRFFAEARIAARLSHPGIVVTHDVGRDPEGGTLYIVLEYLQGRTLAEIVKESIALEWREALRITRRVAEALHYAHSQRVIHRDIKPANIMILPSGEPKIMDFGIAKLETARIKLTMGGQFFGTPLYLSPEQALGRKVDARMDLFSLGAVAYTLLTGRLAFEAENLTRIISRVVLEDPPPPSEVVPGLPRDVDYVVARALAKRPDDRYPDGEALAEDIEDVLGGRAPRHQASWTPPAPAEALGVSEGGPYAEPELVPDEPDLDLVMEELTDKGKTPALDLESELATLVSKGSALPATARPQVPLVARPAPEPPWAASAPRRGEARPWGRIGERGGRWGLALLVVALAFAVPLWVRRGEPPAASPRSATATPAPRPSPSAAPVTWPSEPPSTWLSPVPAAPAEARTAPAPQGPVKPARLAVDFEHPLKSGTLRIWLDEELVMEEELDSRVTKKAVVFRKRRGSVEEVLEVSPGKHVVKVEVAWQDNVKTKQISGTFKAGATRRLEARVAGLLKKNLSLEWK